MIFIKLNLIRTHFTNKKYFKEIFYLILCQNKRFFSPSIRFIQYIHTLSIYIKGMLIYSKINRQAKTVYFRAAREKSISHQKNW